tara:strand:- start:585 stop:749 length:165 start_codon:yes stop_codon:yes gene_type:complete
MIIIIIIIIIINRLFDRMAQKETDTEMKGAKTPLTLYILLGSLRILIDSHVVVR